MTGKGTPADAQLVFDRLAAEQSAAPNVTMGRGLSNKVLKVNNKIFAFVNDGRLVVKLPAARCASLVGGGDGVAFTSGGRTMKEWVAVALPPGAGGEPVWRELMAEAHAYVGRT
jgi:hypothetical protein